MQEKRASKISEKYQDKYEKIESGEVDFAKDPYGQSTLGDDFSQLFQMSCSKYAVLSGIDESIYSNGLAYQHFLDTGRYNEIAWPVYESIAEVPDDIYELTQKTQQERSAEQKEQKNEGAISRSLTVNSSSNYKALAQFPEYTNSDILLPYDDSYGYINDVKEQKTESTIKTDVLKDSNISEVKGAGKSLFVQDGVIYAPCNGCSITYDDKTKIVLPDFQGKVLRYVSKQVNKYYNQKFKVMKGTFANKTTLNPELLSSPKKLGVSIKNSDKPIAEVVYGQANILSPHEKFNFYMAVGYQNN